MKDLKIGNLYDFNKTLVKQAEIKLSDSVINSKKEVIKNFLRKKDNQYYMLLCNERKDYTVFSISPYDENIYINHDHQYKELIDILVDECLVNRGEIRGIDETKDKEAIEIWMIIEDEAYVYYFFPYDRAVITV